MRFFKPLAKLVLVLGAVLLATNKSLGLALIVVGEAIWAINAWKSWQWGVLTACVVTMVLVSCCLIRCLQ